MDYFDILKRAWNITWKYKMLWVLGLFAGAGSGGSSNGGSSYSGNTGSGDYPSASVDQFTRWATDNVALIAVGIGLLVVIGFIWWVLSIAAQGGLVHGANEAAEGRTPSLRASWGVGFSKWGRTFMIGFVLGLPVAVVAIVMALVFIAMIGGGAALGDEAAMGAALAGGVCLVLPIFVVLVVAMSLIIGIVYQLALRYGVLDDITFGQAIRRGWDDLWAKRGAFMMFLVMILPGFAAGLIMLLFMLPFMVPAIAFAVAEKFVMAGAMFVLMALVMMVPTAVYGTFISSAWTVFFRRMTGREPSAKSVPAYAPPDAYGMAPVAPVADVPASPMVEQSTLAPAVPVADAEPIIIPAEEAVSEPVVEPEPAMDAPVYVEAPEPPAADAGFAKTADEVPPGDA